MAAPGSFTAGQVLTAAEMNALPGGVVARVSSSPAQTVTTVTDMTGITVTWTPVSSSRVYLVIAQLEIYNSNATSIATVQITDGSNNVKQDGQLWIDQANLQTTYTLSYVETGLSGSTTRKVRFGRGFGNTGNVVTFSFQQLTVIDIGST